MSRCRLLSKIAAKFCTFVFGVGILAGCEQTEQHPPYKNTAYVFGTLVDIVIQGTPEKQAKAAVAELSAGFQTLHNDWHAWKPLGEVYKINQACASGVSVPVSDKTLDALRKAKSYYQNSHALFNAAIGQVVSAWGFHGDKLPKGHRPDFTHIQSLIAQKPSMDDIQIDGNAVTCSNAAVGLDFGGFGKGLALDWALAELKAKGIQNALVNAGGDVSTMGQAVDGKIQRPWKIGIRHPKNWGVLASVEAKADEAVYTSGNYERYNDHDGLKHSHIIDPRNGQAVQTIVSTTVIHKSGALADAAATALSVAGPEGWPDVAKSMGVELVLLVDENGGMYASDAMAERLIFENGKAPNIKVHKF